MRSRPDRTAPTPGAVMYLEVGRDCEGWSYERARVALLSSLTTCSRWIQANTRHYFRAWGGRLGIERTARGTEIESKSSTGMAGVSRFCTAVSTRRSIRRASLGPMRQLRAIAQRWRNWQTEKAGIGSLNARPQGWRSSRRQPDFDSARPATLSRSTPVCRLVGKPRHDAARSRRVGAPSNFRGGRCRLAIGFRGRQSFRRPNLFGPETQKPQTA